MRILGRIRDYLNLVRFEHTIFALPFAYIGALFAWRIATPTMPPFDFGIHTSRILAGYFNVLPKVADWLPFPPTLGWLTLAVMGARTAAMALNRVIDAEVDAGNPRTAGREIPKGTVSRSEALGLAGAGLLVLVLATWMLDARLLVFLPIPALFLVGYSYTKRFTSWCHVILGATDGFAPLGAAVAVIFTVSDRVAISDLSLSAFPIGQTFVYGLVLFCAVTLWVAGFDIYYSIQDIEFDRANKVFSLPSTWGIKPSLHVALLMHLGTVALLWWVGERMGLDYWYNIGVAIAGMTLLVENLLVRRSRELIGVAFFTANGILSVVVLAFTVIALVTQPHFA